MTDLGLEMRVLCSGFVRLRFGLALKAFSFWNLNFPKNGCGFMSIPNISGRHGMSYAQKNANPLKPEFSVGTANIEYFVF